MPTAFEVISEPHRRRILDLLLEQPRPVGELTGLLGLTQPGTSRHLRVLREAGLVRVSRDAQRRWYELQPAALAEIDAWLQPYRRLWAGRLDELERHLDRPARKPAETPAGSAGERKGSSTGRKRRRKGGPDHDAGQASGG
jgi:DNA-binding transcriptional ArsR family regulator